MSPAMGDLLKPNRRPARAARRMVRTIRGASPQTPEQAAYAATLVDTVWQPPPDEHLTVNGQSFVITSAPQLLDGDGESTQGIAVFKTPAMVHRYLELAAEREHATIVELGIFQGGGTAFLFQVFQPAVLVAFEIEENPAPALERFVDAHALRDRVHLFYGTHQADTQRVLQRLETAVGTSPLDFVVDDASHSYVPSRTTFGALFPLLREGGVYVLEDWEWSHMPGDRWQRDGGYRPGEPSLTNLLVEILVLQGTRPDIVREVRVRRDMAEIVRGEATLSTPIDMAALSLNRGKPFEPFL
jgi:predicted O-methyltransferase YrrM